MHKCPSFDGGRYYKNEKPICNKLKISDIKTKLVNIKYLSVNSDFYLNIISYPLVKQNETSCPLSYCLHRNIFVKLWKKN